MTILLQRTISFTLREQKERKISPRLTSLWARSPNRSSTRTTARCNDSPFAQFSFAVAREPSSGVSAAHRPGRAQGYRDHHAVAGCTATRIWLLWARSGEGCVSASPHNLQLLRWL